MATSRTGLRLSHFLRTTPLSRQAIRRNPRHNILQHRTQTTIASDGASQQSGFSKFWNSQVGPKTVHFWAPIMKWALVLAGVSDFARPAESLSLSQNLALMATGAIWTRWCTIIKPRNLFLAAVNFFLFCVGSVQVGRILNYRQSLKQDSLGDEMKKAASEQKEAVKGYVDDAKKIVKG